MEKKFHGNALAKLVASIENAYVDSENEIPLLKPARSGQNVLALSKMQS